MVEDGTLFIDEIGELPLDMQPNLLRAIEDRTFEPLGTTTRRPFKGRIVAATHRNLRACAEAGEFRKDLYYRLAVLVAKVPPLRQRRDDIPLLLSRILERSAGAEAPKINQEVMNLLMAYDWPGNVRELRNVASRLAVFPEEDPLSPEDPLWTPPILPAPARNRGQLTDLPIRDARDRFEREYVEAVLDRFSGNHSQAATHMGLSRQHLYELLGKHGLRQRPSRP